MADPLGGFSHKRREEEALRAASTDEIPAPGALKNADEAAKSAEEAAPDVFLASPTGLFTGMIAAFIPGIGPLIAAGPLAGAIAGLSVKAEPPDSPES